MADFWSAKIYSQFLDIRTRPAKDLLAVIPTSFQPKTIYDLGCGPGNSTILLKDRWPDAKLFGLDSSTDMLDEAKRLHPEIQFIRGDIADFSSSEKVDALFANASLQWLCQHQTLLPKLLQYLNVGGVLAIQMPNNFHEPSHQVAIKILQNNPSWEPLLARLFFSVLTEPLYNVSWYYDVLTKSGIINLQCWETVYFQEMENYQEVFEWIKGTGLRTALSLMNNVDQTQFADAYIKTIALKYPLQANNKVLFPFRRIFIVGYKEETL